MVHQDRGHPDLCPDRDAPSLVVQIAVRRRARVARSDSRAEPQSFYQDGRKVRQLLELRQAEIRPRALLSGSGGELRPQAAEYLEAAVYMVQRQDTEWISELILAMSYLIF